MTPGASRLPWGGVIPVSVGYFEITNGRLRRASGLNPESEGLALAITARRQLAVCLWRKRLARPTYSRPRLEGFSDGRRAYARRGRRAAGGAET
jgi:hypothetical protein